ncbi:hypothetical protein JZ751_017110 [Albula glossodonta]|uniref:Uncharacterized protein n=1 Tax=Albula glossodonta TaxID=121402 RepID=A0A8T2NX33_9TELE|nr:hypothetical protein JZ751_017110 [Albula glossodonta]
MPDEVYLKQHKTAPTALPSPPIPGRGPAPLAGEAPGTKRDTEELIDTNNNNEIRDDGVRALPRQACAVSSEGYGRLPPVNSIRLPVCKRSSPHQSTPAMGLEFTSSLWLQWNSKMFWSASYTDWRLEMAVKQAVEVKWIGEKQAPCFTGGNTFGLKQSV